MVSPDYLHTILQDTTLTYFLSLFMTVLLKKGNKKSLSLFVSYNMSNFSPASDALPVKHA
jgi:hypothetical protein